MTNESRLRRDLTDIARTRLMRSAIEQARASLADDGLPYGASLGTKDGRVLSLGRNRLKQNRDTFSHSITDCLRNAGRRTNWNQLVVATTATPSLMDLGVLAFLDIGEIIVADDRYRKRIDAVLSQCTLSYHVLDFGSEEAISASDLLDQWCVVPENQQLNDQDNGMYFDKLDPRNTAFSKADPEVRVTVVHALLGTAYEQAKQSMAEGGIPVGACLSKADGSVVATAANSRVQQHNPVGHAATECIRRAGPRSDWNDLVMAVTIEPTPVDVGLLAFYGIGTVIVGDGQSSYKNLDPVFNLSLLRSKGVEVVYERHALSIELLEDYLSTDTGKRNWIEDTMMDLE